MRNKKGLTVAVTAFLVAILIVSALVSACAQEEPTPTTPATTTPATQPAAETYQWRMVTMGTAASPWHTLEQGFIDKVEGMSDGRIQIDLFAKGDLFPVGETVSNVGKGTVELAGVTPDYQKGLDKRFANISYLVNSPLQTPSDYNVMMEFTPYKQAVQDLYAEYNCKWIGWRTGPNEQMLTDTPIRGIEDFEGVKLRGSGPSELLFNKLGAKATYIDFGEIYTAVQLGTIAGGDMTGAKGNWDMGFHEVTGYIIEPMLYTSSFTMDHYTNMDTWNGLSPELQDMLIVATQAHNLDAFTQEAGQDLSFRQKMIEEAGLEVITMPPEDQQKIREMAQEIWDDLAAMDEMSQIRVDAERHAAKLLGIPGFEQY